MLGLDAGQAVLAWLLAAAGFAVHLTVPLRRDRGRPENSSNRAVNAVWSGIGWCIFAFWVGAAIMSYRKGDAFLMNAISLHVLAVYGVGWTVAAVMTGRGWMQFNAAMAPLTVPVLGALVGTGQEYLAYAIALVLTVIVPGVRIMREARLIEPSPSGS